MYPVPLVTFHINTNLCNIHKHTNNKKMQILSIMTIDRPVNNNQDSSDLSPDHFSCKTKHTITCTCDWVVCYKFWSQVVKNTIGKITENAFNTIYRLLNGYFCTVVSSCPTFKTFLYRSRYAGLEFTGYNQNFSICKDL